MTYTDWYDSNKKRIFHRKAFLWLPNLIDNTAKSEYKPKTADLENLVDVLSEVYLKNEKDVEITGGVKSALTSLCSAINVNQNYKQTMVGDVVVKFAAVSKIVFDKNNVILPVCKKLNTSITDKMIGEQIEKTVQKFVKTSKQQILSSELQNHK